MYRCDVCGCNTAPRVGCKMVVVEKRRFLHPERLRAKKGMIVLKNGKEKMVWLPDPGGWGYQIMRESKMCPPCVKAWDEKKKMAAA